MNTSLESIIPTGSTMNVRFCFSIEELESWFMADKAAILTAFPKANEQILSTYIQDDICGTWEMFSKVIGSNATDLPKRDCRVLAAKCEWAKKIAPHMNVELNLSESFQYFKNCLTELLPNICYPSRK